MTEVRQRVEAYRMTAVRIALQGRGAHTRASRLRNFTIPMSSGIWNCNSLKSKGGGKYAGQENCEEDRHEEKEEEVAEVREAGLSPRLSPSHRGAPRREEAATGSRPRNPADASLAHTPWTLNKVISSQV